MFSIVSLLKSKYLSHPNNSTTFDYDKKKYFYDYIQTWKQFPAHIFALAFNSAFNNELFS